MPQPQFPDHDRPRLLNLPPNPKNKCMKGLLIHGARSTTPTNWFYCLCQRKNGCPLFGTPPLLLSFSDSYGERGLLFSLTPLNSLDTLRLSPFHRFQDIPSTLKQSLWSCPLDEPLGSSPFCELQQPSKHMTKFSD